jgi:phosphomethylpyrimidine synthase
MKITQDVRERGLDPDDALEPGMAEKAAEFRAAGGRVHRPE